MAPWVSFETAWPSTKLNIHKDIDALVTVHTWSQAYLNGRSSDPYTEAVLAPEGWWDNAKVEHVLVVAGADEILVDPIGVWVTKFRVRLSRQFQLKRLMIAQMANPNITFEIGKHECHIAPLIWPLFGDTRETEQGRAIKDWMKAKLCMSQDLPSDRTPDASSDVDAAVPLPLQ